MNRRFIRFISALLLLSVLPFALMAHGLSEGPLDGSGELVVLHTNDFHGHPLKFYNYPAPNLGDSRR